MKEESMSRPWFMRPGPALTAIGLVAMLAALPAAQVQAQKRSGELIIAQIAPPPTLDPHFSTSISTRNVAMNIFETLVTRDENNAVVPELAESITASPDGLTYTFKLRQGVTFHNGKPMTSADVLASYERYKRMGLARVTLAPVAEMTAPDKDSFVLKLSKPVPVFLEELSAFVVPIAIIPSEEAGKEGGKIELIGTGPFQFGEWVPDSHVRLKRYEGYKPDQRYKGTDGFAGRKEAWFDTVTFRLVKEDSARVAGLEAGQFHIIEDLPTESAKRLEGNKTLVIKDQKNWWLHSAWVNLAKAPTDNLLVRRAVQAALDMEEIMEISSDGAYDLQPGFQYPGNPYYVTDGADRYNMKNPALAKQLLQQAGYKGEELVLMTNSSYRSMYNAAVVVSEQLKNVGIKVRMDVFDWATAIAKRKDKDSWNLWFTGQGSGPSVGPYAALRDIVSPQLNQFVPDPTLDQIYGEMVGGATEADRKAAFGRFQARVYDQVTFLKFGDLTRKQATRANVKGYEPYRIPRAWNVWVE